MIETNVRYRLVCDKCKARFRNGLETFWEDWMITEAKADGWRVSRITGRAKCPECAGGKK